MNCLTYALSRWHEHGGALRIVRSRHWGMPHVLHEAQDGTVTHYVPPRALGKPRQSLLGCDGRGGRVTTWCAARCPCSASS